MNNAAPVDNVHGRKYMAEFHLLAWKGLRIWLLPIESSEAEQSHLSP